MSRWRAMDLGRGETILCDTVSVSKQLFRRKGDPRMEYTMWQTTQLYYKCVKDSGWSWCWSTRCCARVEPVTPKGKELHGALTLAEAVFPWGCGLASGVATRAHWNPTVRSWRASGRNQASRCWSGNYRWTRDGAGKITWWIRVGDGGTNPSLA